MKNPAEPLFAPGRRAVLSAVLLLGAMGAMAAFISARALKPAPHLRPAPHLAAGAVANAPGPFPTVARPLPLFAKQMTLANAETVLGQAIVLPQSDAVAPSDAGPVWAASGTDQTTGVTTTTVAVTFPAQGMVFEYTRPAPSDGSASHFQAMTKSMPSRRGGSAGQVISLNGGVPALAVQQNSDDTGANFGEIAFNVNGTEIRVMGHNERATLKGLAESILGRSTN